MPLEYIIFSEQRIVLERFKGQIRAPEVQLFIEEIWANEAYHKSFDTIVDLTEAELDMKPSDIAAITEFIFSSPNAAEGRVAIIASKPIETALGFLFQSSTAMKNDIAVFSTWTSVREFLALPAYMVGELVGKF